MKYKQLILKKIFELSNFLNAQRALVSTLRSADEQFAQLEKLEAKLKEIEVLINSEQETF
jgi:hypothetical protein